MRKLLFLCLLMLCLPLAVHAADEEEEAKPKPIPLYYMIEKPLVTNLVGGPKYIKAEVQLMYYQPDEVEYDSKELLDRYAPALRHELLLLFVEQDGKVLKTPGGKEKLRKVALKKLQKLMEELSGQPVIEDMYFTSYYVR